MKKLNVKISYNLVPWNLWEVPSNIHIDDLIDIIIPSYREMVESFKSHKNLSEVDYPFVTVEGNDEMSGQLTFKLDRLVETYG